FQHQLGSGLNHPIPDCRDAERTFAAARLRDHHPPHRLWPVRLRDEFLAQARQPIFRARRIDLGEGDPVHPRRTRICAGQPIGMAQNVFAANLVVEQVETESRLRLRLAIKLSLKAPDPFRCFEAHRQSPCPRYLRKHTRSQGPSLRRHYPASSVVRPCPTPARSAARCDVGVANSNRSGPPPITRITLPTCRAHIPRRTERVWASIASPFTRPSPLLRRVGVRIFTFEACSGFTRVTARWIAQPPRRPLSRGSNPAGRPTKLLVS